MWWKILFAIVAILLLFVLIDIEYKKYKDVMKDATNPSLITKQLRLISHSVETNYRGDDADDQ